jgi:hypothetical protein
MRINPPPDDMRCDICRRHVDELQPIMTVEEFEAYPYDTTPDRKLHKIFRRVTFNSIENGELVEQIHVTASWECADCLQISQEEVDAFLRSQDWTMVSSDKLHPMDDLRDHLRDDSSDFPEEAEGKE